MPIKDPVKRAEYAAKYRESRREEAKERSRKWREADPERVRETQRRCYIRKRKEKIARVRAYEKTDVGKVLKKKWYKDAYTKNHDKYLCRDRFKKAVAKGWMTRKPCSVCGEPKAQGHHEDYSKPYEVIWFCDYHHKLHEGKILVPRADLGSNTSSETQIAISNTGDTQCLIHAHAAKSSHQVVSTSDPKDLNVR